MAHHRDLAQLTTICLARNFVNNNTYLAPSIPPRKLANAVEKFGGPVRPADVLLLCDCTVFGSAKDGA